MKRGIEMLNYEIDHYETKVTSKVELSVTIWNLSAKRMQSKLATNMLKIMKVIELLLFIELRKQELKRNPFCGF